MNHYKMLQDLLQRPIAFQRPFVDVAGSVLAGLMLSQAYYWTPRTKDADGWFYKTQDEWEKETGMSRYEQEGARKKLRATDFWQEDLRGVPAKLFFRVDTQKLLECLANKYAEEPHASMGKNHILECGNSPYIYTESTTENTAGKRPLQKAKEETIGQWANKRGQGLKYCDDYNWKIHREPFEAIVDAMGKRALVDADNDRTIGDLQKVAVTLVKAGMTAEDIKGKTAAWKESYFGQRNGGVQQFIDFMATENANTHTTTPVVVNVPEVG